MIKSMFFSRANLFQLVLGVFCFLLSSAAFGQSVKLEEYGLRHFQITFRKDTVDILVQSKKGEEKKIKPIILIEKGSLPVPLILHQGGKPGSIMPFRGSEFTVDYHLVFISKPFTPLMAEPNDLAPNMTYGYPEKDKQHPEFSKRDLPEYYVSRDLEVIRFLKKQPWVDKNKLVLAGHSEGGGIVARVAAASKDVTHVIYSSANPFGRMANIMASIREDDDSVATYAEKQFAFWETIVEKQNDTEYTGGNSYKNMFDFSEPANDYLARLKIPVLVTYGTRDYSAPFNDYLRLDMTRKKKRNFSFIGYPGLDHNYFQAGPDGKPIIDMAGWNKAAEDWRNWLLKN